LAAAAAAAAVALGGGLLLLAAPPAAAYPTPDVTFVGHGWGHGIGMGQWGALGYAVGQDQGLGPQTYQWIVNHYYTPATLQNDAADAGDNVNVKIALTENNGSDVIATAPGGVTVPGTTAQSAVLFQPVGGNVFQVWDGPGCAGPWAMVGSPVANPATSPVSASSIELCNNGISYHGSLDGVFNSSGAARTVNVVNLGQYLDDVVTSESSGGWATLGGPGPQGQDWGFQELEAQAVAARSYVLSTPNGYGGYADTCDQTCQSYPGITNESAIGILAVSSTAGEVMEVGTGGPIAVTEYSASTGGYTTGGPFTIEPDAGDGICIPGACNPNHDWRAPVPVSTIEADWPAVGTLTAVNVTQRNGYGDYGGRVLSVNLVGTGGTVQLTGPEFADNIGLNSDWFELSAQPSGGVGGYVFAAADGGVFAFGNATYWGSMGGQPLNEPIVGLASTADQKGYWEVASDGGIFSFGDAHFWGSMGGRPLNEPVVGMAADPATGGYWEVASDGGIFSFNAPFHGSMGGQPLNQPVVAMASTPDGGGYWLVASDGGIFSFGDAHYWGSTGSMTLQQPIVGMAPTGDGGGYWLVAADGGVFTFGDAGYQGSAAGTPAGVGTAALIPTHTGLGYLIVTSVGQATNFGDAPQFGDLTTVLSSYSGRVVAAAVTPG